MKRFFWFIVTLAILATLAVPALAQGPDGYGPYGSPYGPPGPAASYEDPYPYWMGYNRPPQYQQSYETRHAMLSAFEAGIEAAECDNLCETVTEMYDRGGPEAAEAYLLGLTAGKEMNDPLGDPGPAMRRMMNLVRPR